MRKLGRNFQHVFTDCILPCSLTVRQYSWTRDKSCKVAAAASRVTRMLERDCQGTTNSDKYEHRFQTRKDVKQSFLREVLSLTPKHFENAKSNDLIALLLAAVTIKVQGSQSVYLAARVLLQRLSSLTNAQLMLIFKVLSSPRFVTFSKLERRSHMVTVIVNFLLQSGRYKQLSPRQSCLLLRKAADSQNPLLPSFTERELIQALLTHWSDDGRFAREFTGAEVAVYAHCVANLKVTSSEAVQFFVKAVPLCLRDAELLRGREISFILEAYAIVGYHDSKLFVSLGEHAGRMGESLDTDDVGRVLRAFGKTKIDDTVLRKSLESSMNLRQMQRRR